MDWTILVVPIAGLGRNVIGWLENSFKDGSISKYEWGQLGATILRFCVIGAGFYFGLNLDVATATGATLLTDIGLTALKKAGTDGNVENKV